jgi:hypothetical protein
MEDRIIGKDPHAKPLRRKGRIRKKRKKTAEMQRTQRKKKTEALRPLWFIFLIFASLRLGALAPLREVSCRVLGFMQCFCHDDFD